MDRAPEYMKGSGLAAMAQRAAPVRIERRRVCARRGCTTVLSAFNQGNRCWIHEPAIFKPIRVERRPRDGDAAA